MDAAEMSDIRVFEAASPEHYHAARCLLEAYARSLPFDLAFQGFQDEILRLPGDYAAPTGAFLLAERAGQYVGCVALRKIDDATCEMKRLYVVPSERGRHVGRMLAAAVIAAARRRRYSLMRLDTVPSMVEAKRLYESLGFHETVPYRFNPVAGATFMELAL